MISCTYPLHQYQPCSFPLALDIFVSCDVGERRASKPNFWESLRLLIKTVESFENKVPFIPNDFETQHTSTLG